MADLPEWPGEMGRTWARHHAATDRQLAEVGAALIDRLAPRPGERLLELGCGAGGFALSLAAAVGPAGRVTGIDVSPDLVAVARERAAGTCTVEIHLADAAHRPMTPGAHDALVSRHGCMFFEDPAAAFANLRRGLVPGGRVALSAFASPADNPWASVPADAAAGVLGPADPPAPGVPGPFAWAEPRVFETALAEAGFRDITHETRAVGFTLALGDDPDPVQRAVAMVLTIGPVARRARLAGDGAADRLRPVLRDALAPYLAEGAVRLPARIRLISARA